MKETSKAAARRKQDPYLMERVLVGNAIDIGGGDDPLAPGDYPGLQHVTCLDQYPPNMWDKLPRVPGVKRLQGDAHNPHVAVGNKSFDLVHSSNCLEHLNNPHGALCNWWKLVMPGGHMLITVPDETLYEHGYWPPRFNTDHKFSFRNIGDPATPVSIEIEHLALSLWQVKIVYCKLIDTAFDYDLLKTHPEIDQTLGDAEAFIEVLCRKELT